MEFTVEIGRMIGQESNVGVGMGIIVAAPSPSAQLDGKEESKYSQAGAIEGIPDGSQIQIG